MIYFIKLIFFLLISNNVLAIENKKNEILFQINNKVFTIIDLEKRTEYVKTISKLQNSKLNEKEKKEILEDYISALIFYEYYIQNKIRYENINDEINQIIKKKFTNKNKINNSEIENFKINTTIDLIRNKIIEKQLNLEKNTLLKEVNKIDLLYNYNLRYLIIKEEYIDKELLEKIKNRNDFDNLNNYLIDKNINFFYKEEDINDSAFISKKIKEIIDIGLPIYISNYNGYINIISINKNFESYDGIFVKLINFKTDKPIEKKDLKCDNLNTTIGINKTIFKEYEYAKLNENIKNNLKSINDYILFNDNDVYNYVVLCEVNYDENLLKNIHFNKNVNNLVSKIQKNFLKKYKYEYKFIKIK